MVLFESSVAMDLPQLVPPLCIASGKHAFNAVKALNRSERKENTMSREEVIWAPWRMSYIQELSEAGQATQLTPDYDFLPDAVPDCFLCQAVADVAPHAAQWRHRVAMSEQTITVLNKYPYNNGHLLVAPRRHVGNLSALTTEEQLGLMQEVTRMTERLRDVVHPDGFNVGINLGRVAGAGLPGHLHIHIVPRWNGDINFMPAIGGIKVIPQSLDALWDALTRVV